MHLAEYSPYYMDSVVGSVTSYGLDGPELESRHGEEIFIFSKA